MHWDVGVELCQPRNGDGCSRGSDVLLSKEELSSKVCDLNGVGVEEGDGFDSGECDVLRCRGGNRERLRRGEMEGRDGGGGGQLDLEEESRQKDDRNSPISTPRP